MSQTIIVMDPTVLRKAAGEAVGASKVLANEDRLRLLGQLSHGEMSVGDLEDALAIRQPTLSQQLGVLRTEGIVKTRREGKRIFYSVADPDVMRLLNILYHVYGTRSDPRSIESLASDCSTGASAPVAAMRTSSPRAGLGLSCHLARHQTPARTRRPTPFRA